MKRKTKRKNPLNKIIFLDHDGVIALSNDDNDFTFFNPSCVEILNEILLDTKAEIVVDSDWRLHYDLRALQDIYRDEGIIKVPFAITPDFYTRHTDVSQLEELRSQEILYWLSQYKVDRWVAIDDMKLNLENFVQTDPQKGLMTRGVKKKVIEILNG